MAEPVVRIEGFQAAVDEVLQDVAMAGGEDTEGLEVEDAANGDVVEEAELEEMTARSTFLE